MRQVSPLRSSLPHHRLQLQLHLPQLHQRVLTKRLPLLALHLALRLHHATRLLTHRPPLRNLAQQGLC